MSTSKQHTSGPYSVKVKFREPAGDVFLMAGDGVTIIARQVAAKGLHTKANFDLIALSMNCRPDLIATIEALIEEVNRHIGNPEISPLPSVIAARAAIARATS
jgi:hypothetical protein